MSEKQKQMFLAGEGDAYFARNKTVLSAAPDMAAADPVLDLARGLRPFPSRVLEVGCANGWRLDHLAALGASACHGIDPSSLAIDEGKARNGSLDLRVGTADALPYADAAVDLLIFGFCLYLCDPADHWRIVCEADRVLADGGRLLIHDFDPPAPYRNAYAHKPGVYSYKMDFSRLFLAHPHYRMAEKRTLSHGRSPSADPDDRLTVCLLAKDTATAWPLNPWKRVGV